MAKPLRLRQLDYAADNVLNRTVLLTRLMVRELGGTIPRAELGLLRALSEGPRRISELAEVEGIAQPTTTLLVKRLERQGLVTRERQVADQRVVLVALTEAGEEAYRRAREHVISVLHTHLDQLSGDQLTALIAGLDALDDLIAVMLEPTRTQAAA